MKAKPILFSTPMVEALLEDRKTQTRRAVRPLSYIDFPAAWKIQNEKGDKLDHHPKCSSVPGHHPLSGPAFLCDCKAVENEWIRQKIESCPFGEVGDLLWVRETFAIASNTQEAKLRNPYIYRADGDAFINWKPSIFMPKDASRITLEITNIRVERLQDISQEDAKAEGVEPFDIDYDNYSNAHKIDFGKNPTFRGGYIKIWEDINGERSWDKNPFVWVIEFKVHKCNYQELIGKDSA